MKLYMAERPDLSKLSSDEKEALIMVLLERIAELERRLGLNSSNSGKPPSSDGFKKPSRVNNQRVQTGRKSGGQAGHEGTTLRQVATPDQVSEYFPPVCTGCGGALSIEQATGHEKRQVLNIPQPVASTWLLTCYRTSAMRGAMWAGVRGIIVHDFWRPSLTLGDVTHALCNAHHLRELKALMDIAQEPWARTRHRFLRQTCHAAHLVRAQQRSVSLRFLAWVSACSARLLAHGGAFHEQQPPLGVRSPTRRGRVRRRTGHNRLLRLHDHKAATLRFLSEPTVPFPNNQAERDWRMRKVRQKISGGFRSEAGAQTLAALRTVLSMARKQGWNILAPLATPPPILMQNLRSA